MNSITHQKDHSPSRVGLTSCLQGWFSTCKSINVIHHINKVNNKNHMIISIETVETFDKIEQLLVLHKKKALSKLYIKGTFLNSVKANIILDGEKLEY